MYIRVAFLCAAVAFLDGFDTTSIAVAVPLIAERLHLQPPQLGLIFSSALFGAALGAASFGRLADRFGRKTMLLAATLIFGLFTLATAFASSFGQLLAIRFLTGIGLGGATPCFIALVTEFTPGSLRAKVTSLVWAAFPLGAFAGTFLCAYLISVSGWQSIFITGGIAPIAVFVALAIWMPESVRFLQLKGGLITEHISAGRPGMRGLFLTSGTVLLWFAFLVTFGSLVAVFSFAPTVMRSHGISLSRAAVAVGFTSVGPLIGSVMTGWLLERFGPAVVLPAVVALGAAATASVGYVSDSLAATTAVLAVMGLLVGGVGYTGLVALAATFYPLPLRSTGVGCAMAAGRLGQAVLPLVVSGTLMAGFDYSAAFVVLGLILAAGAFALVLLQRHSATVPEAERRLT